MLKSILCAGALCLHAIYFYGQPSCCSGSAASVMLGTGSGSAVLGKNQLKLEFSGFYWQFNSQEKGKGLPAAVADVQNATVTSVGVSFGLTKNVTVSVNQPYLFIQSEVYSLNESDKVVPVMQNSNGFGDMAAMATWQLPINKQLFSTALIGGVELPTGYRDIQNSAIATSIGSGSFDPIVGFVAQKMLSSFVVKASSTYKLTTVNDLGIDYGDFSSSKLLLSYNFEKENCGTIIPDSALTIEKNTFSKNIFAGLALDYLFQQKRQETVVVNTGYDRIYAHFGAGIGLNEKVSLNVSGEIPLLEQLKGYQNKTAYRVRAAISITI